MRVLCTDARHPIQTWLQGWCQQQLAAGHDACVMRECQRLDGDGDFLFLVACSPCLASDVRQRFRHNLVLHTHNPLLTAKPPPSGPASLTLSLLSAADEVGRGDIWQQRQLALDGTELHDEIQQRTFAAELELMSWAVLNCDRQRAWPQGGVACDGPLDSSLEHRIDPDRPLTESFDLLRGSDPDRHPVYFAHRGRRYRLRLEAYPEIAAAASSQQQAPAAKKR